MESPKKSKSIFANTSAKQFFVAAVISFVLTLIANSLPGQLFAILTGAFGWVMIICVIAGIVKWLSSRKK